VGDEAGEWRHDMGNGAASASAKETSSMWPVIVLDGILVAGQVSDCPDAHRPGPLLDP
jgi:hypothetical protein